MSLLLLWYLVDQKQWKLYVGYQMVGIDSDLSVACNETAHPGSMNNEYNII